MLTLQTGQEGFPANRSGPGAPDTPLALATQRGGHLFHTTYKHYRSSWPKVALGLAQLALQCPLPTFAHSSPCPGKARAQVCACPSLCLAECLTLHAGSGGGHVWNSTGPGS